MIPLDIAQLSAAVAYLVVFGIIVVESGLLVGIVFPGDSVLFMAGLFAARLDSPLALPVLIVTVFTAAVVGDSLGYGIGRRFGRPYLVRGLRKRGAGLLIRAERLYERHGWFAIVTARWIPWIRTIVPTLAGIGHMPYVVFLAANAFGAVLWAVGLVVLGYLSASIPGVYQLSIAAMGVSVLVIVLYIVIQWRHRSLPRQI